MNKIKVFLSISISLSTPLTYDDLEMKDCDNPKASQDSPHANIGGWFQQKSYVGPQTNLHMFLPFITLMLLKQHTNVLSLTSPTAYMYAVKIQQMKIT